MTEAELHRLQLAQVVAYGFHEACPSCGAPVAVPCSYPDLVGGMCRERVDPSRRFDGLEEARLNRVRAVAGTSIPHLARRGDDELEISDEDLNPLRIIEWMAARQGFAVAAAGGAK